MATLLLIDNDLWSKYKKLPAASVEFHMIKDPNVKMALRCLDSARYTDPKGEGKDIFPDPISE